jgi:hypothetical protein
MSPEPNSSTPMIVQANGVLVAPANPGHATLLLAAGANAKVVSERLGHSSVAFTLDTYAHAMPEPPQGRH